MKFVNNNLNLVNTLWYFALRDASRVCDTYLIQYNTCIYIYTVIYIYGVHNIKKIKMLVHFFIRDILY